MNTDKLMELERKWRGMNCRTEAQDRVYRVCADELAALRAEQAVGDEQIARELLAEEYERDGYENSARRIREMKVLTEDDDAALRAIRRALGAARQSGPANPVPAPWIEAGGLMARICETKYGVGISYNCDEAITAFRDFFARQSEGVVVAERMQRLEDLLGTMLGVESMIWSECTDGQYAEKMHAKFNDMREAAPHFLAAPFHEEIGEHFAALPDWALARAYRERVMTLTKDSRESALVFAAYVTPRACCLEYDAKDAEGWLRIETAPRAREVLVWRSDSGPFIAKYVTPEDVISDTDLADMEFPEGYEEWFSDAYGWQEGSEKPTHWRPLPPPPAPGGEGEG